MFVCLFVYPLAYLKTTCPNFSKINVYVDRASNDNGIRYVIPVSWITGRLVTPRGGE